jgi:transcriptional regulator with XRE-family HTH domain
VASQPKEAIMVGYQPQPRVCARCNARLALDNVDRFCSACRSKANDDLVRPPTFPRFFWLDDHMAAALDSWHMGKVFAAYRTHPQHGRTLSQELVAGWLSLTQAQLSRIESGRAPEELSKLIHWANVLGIPSDLLWFKLPSDRRTAPQRRVRAAVGQARRPTQTTRHAGVDRTPHPAPSERTMADIQRRTLLSSGIAALSLPALGLDDLKHIVAALDDSRRYLDHEIVDYFQQQITNCANDDGARGPRETLPVVLGIIGAIEHHAHEVKPDVRRQLVAVGAESAEFAGWLYRDSATPKLADYWRDRAVEWAQEAGDMSMQGYILLKKSQAAWDNRDAVRMLTLAQAAQDGPWKLPPKVRAEAAQQEARGHAMLGADLAVVERKLDEARALLEDAAETANEASKLSSHYDESLLAMQTAICFTEAGKPLRAVDIYRQELSARAFSRRDYGYFQSLMASTLAAAGEPDEAAQLGMGALEVAASTDSRRTVQELRRLTGRLEPWANRAMVRELHDALAA